MMKALAAFWNKLITGLDEPSVSAAPKTAVPAPTPQQPAPAPVVATAPEQDTPRSVPMEKVITTVTQAAPTASPSVKLTGSARHIQSIGASRNQALKLTAIAKTTQHALHLRGIQSTRKRG